MATNNPHLAKKRSSRRSLARSILRRSGAELAESASRRSSAGERAGTLSRRSSSAKRLVDAAGTGLRMRDENSRRRSSALRKSRSSEGPPREPRRGSPTRSPPEEPPPAAVMDLEQSDSDSLDAAPLLCKSASAQNLAGHRQRPPPLQKSHSVVSGAREVALLRATRDQRLGSRHLSAPAPGVPSDPASPQSPRAERGSQEDAAPLGDAKGHKRVTYAPIKSVSVDSAHPPRKVRVTVKKTPPAPPVRYQSLQRSGTLGDSPEPPPGPPVQAGEAEGTAGHDPERASPPAGKGRLLTPTASSAHVCPWELVQDEILGRKQKAAEAAESGTPGDTAATTAGPKPPPAKSFRSLGLAIKALNRSRGKSVLKGKSEGSLRKRGSGRREKPGLAEASAVSLGGLSPNPAAKIPERSGQSLEAPALQQNNNAATAGEAADWGDSGAGGQSDSLAAGTGDGDKAARGNAGTGDEAPAAHRGKDVPGLPAEEGTLEELEGTSRSFQPRDHPEEEQPPAKPTPSSVRGAAAGPKPRAELGPPGSLGIPAGRGALLRQQAIAPREDAGNPESPEKVPGERSSQPDSERGPGRSWSGAGRAQGELRPGGTRGDSSPKAGICPGKGGSEGGSQRSPGMEKAAELPKAAPEEAEGRRAEVCPWESREQGGSVRAEICPWDTEGALPEQGSPKSGEGVEQPGMGLAGKRPALPKASSQRAGTTESKKANICPWEVEGEPRPKTKICPWEEAAAPSGKERPGQDTGGTSKGEKKVGSRATEKGKQHPAKSLPKSPSGRSQSSEKAAICPWESQGSKSSDKAEICPWEVAEPQLEKGTTTGKEKLPGKETTKALEKGSRERESICPWESPDTELPPAKPQTGSSARPKGAPGTSQSSEKAEICPWESQDVESSSKAEICPWETESSDKSEICPWEVAAPQLEKEKGPNKKKLPSREASKVLEKGSRERESICPWESQGSKSSDKAEICPWEVAAPQLEKEKASSKEKLTPEEASKAVEKGSRERESICPWESPDMEELSLKSAAGKEPSKKSDSTESRKSEICPWEAAEPIGLEEEISQPQRMGQPGASAVSPTLVEKSRGRSHGKAEHKPLCRVLPRSQHPGVGSSPSLAEVCPWGAGEAPAAPAKPGLDTRKSSEVCPWEEESTDPSRTRPGQGRARDGGGV
uniref:Uncharacterized protein n=1 Tax=Chloebia gouldiae TaxID=44316 RepID=A0A3L8Q7I3_CHLGU|nr:hypothetical protein DV515_00018428 [Chloebia gouldiae]